MEQEKICASCGRRFAMRKKWERTWSTVRYCSSACSRRRISKIDRAIEAEMLRLLESRTGSICPSEVARSLFEADWRMQMEYVRRAARRLAHQGVVSITQSGKRQDPSDFKGPIRIELRRKSNEK